MKANNSPKCGGCKNPVSYRAEMIHNGATHYTCEAHRPGNRVHPTLNPITAPTGMDYTLGVYRITFIGQ